jgi:hypothetical protein
LAVDGWTAALVLWTSLVADSPVLLSAKAVAPVVLLLLSPRIDTMIPPGLLVEVLPDVWSDAADTLPELLVELLSDVLTDVSDAPANDVCEDSIVGPCSEDVLSVFEVDGVFVEVASVLLGVEAGDADVVCDDAEEGPVAAAMMGIGERAFGGS